MLAVGTFDMSEVLFKYFGKPVQYYVTNEIITSSGQPTATNKIVLMAYLFDYRSAADQWSATAVLVEGKVYDIAFNEAVLNERYGLRLYPLDLAPNEPGGAKASQTDWR